MKEFLWYVITHLKMVVKPLTAFTLFLEALVSHTGAHDGVLKWDNGVWRGRLSLPRCLHHVNGDYSTQSHTEQGELV